MRTRHDAWPCRKCGSAQTRVVEQASSLPLSYARCDTCGHVTGFARRPKPWDLRTLMRIHVSPRLRSALCGGAWIGVSVWVVWADYLAAFEIPFPITYILPVLFAANSGYRLTAIAFSVGLPLTRFAFDQWGVWTSAHDPLVNCVIQSFVLAFIAFLVGRHSTELRALRALLPICGWCRRIRVDQRTWQSIEAYVTQHSHVQFTHGLCPECFRTHANDLDHPTALLP